MEFHIMKQYLTVRQLSEKYPAFPQGGVRHLIFHADTNGFSSVIVRVGRKVLIDEDAFLVWIGSQNKTV